MNERLIISVNSKDLTSNTRYSIYEKRYVPPENIYAAAEETIDALESSRVSIADSDMDSAYDYIADIVRDPSKKPHSYMNCDFKFAIIVITIIGAVILTVLFSMFLVNWLKYTREQHA